MMIHVPGRTDYGIKVTQCTEFVDLFPTLVEEVFGDTLPQCSTNSNSEVWLRSL